MVTPDRAVLERTVQDLCRHADPSAAAEVAIRGYGPEIYGFLVALHHDELAASDVFSVWSEHLWRGLPAFAWQCPLRTWSYTIARNASLDYLRAEQRRAHHHAPMPGSEELTRVAEQVRTETRACLRSTVRNKVEMIRDSLPAEDRALLMLRVDQRLDWKEVARILSGEAAATEAGLTREAQRLRKRFQLLKERIKELARREGLLGESS